MMTDDDRLLWKKVTDTVNPIGNPKVQTTYRSSLPLPVSPTTLDLHGLTVNDAHRATLDFIECSGKRSTLTVITGKSGQIRREFERWLDHVAKIHSIAVKSDGGAFTIRILKNYR